MSSTIKFANGSEFPLAGSPELTGDFYNISIIPSSTVTADAVNAVVSVYANTQSFQIGTDGTYGTALTYYALYGNVSVDPATKNILVTLKRKSDDQINIEALRVKNLYLESAISALQARIKEG